MLENYFGSPDIGVTKEEHQRLLAVKAALEIAKASVGSTDAATSCKTDLDLRYVSDHVSNLADSIQQALKNG
ncbi:MULTISPECIES: hypothetical protein [Enterobacter cloacae complex]|uniref:hypothetical protein n=1 Tax=Enterobacter cloacae complex TaxID=354276 RepID=UPI00044CB8F0|nr:MULTISPECIES: hypothetical protein [Enterobacter cloacae complex]EHK3216205.1 hypothetical protein [Enterobacter hormaechei]EHK3221119.1 hypothetical protein [Enterobacter hormaechei]EHK3226070.1 hypothetical protein [Enterobacter hormaechei]EKL1437634.1 hypothetical protein [Enterobacter hormaechei]EKM7551265.1 hypothetical protein [Enterobacter hormaechei]